MLLTQILNSLLLLAPLATAAAVPVPVPVPVPGDAPDPVPVTAPVPTFHGLPITNPNAKHIIPNSYIVVYKDDLDDDTVDAKQAFFAAAIAKRNLDKRDVNGSPLSRSVHAIKIHKWRAMAVQADSDMIMTISSADEVHHVEADTQVFHQAVLAQTNAPTGLVRLSNKAPGEGNYVFDGSSGEGISVYVVDTGILTNHTEFEGRATFGANFINDVDTDENGHGSHVAGTVGGATFGVAKKASLVAVKVLDANGAGSNSGVLKGMQFVIGDVQERNLTGRAVMNLSLGGSYSDAVNKAIQALHDAGIVPVVAAGNEGQDTADSSPGSAPLAITVAAIDAANDGRAYFSNYGKPVDVYAPGVSILSVGIASETATKVLSGTSMACPHVAGLAAYLMSYHGVTDPSQVSTLIKNLAASSGAVVQNNKANTTSIIANNGYV